MDGTGKFSRKSSLPETFFSCENAPKKRLAIGLRPNPLEEHSASPEPLAAIGGQGIEHSQAGIPELGGAVWLGLVGKSRVGWFGRNGKGEHSERT